VLRVLRLVFIALCVGVPQFLILLTVISFGLLLSPYCQ
jgi:hypothetical protein